MVGGGGRMKEGAPSVTSTNIFAALGSLKKKKKKEQGSSKAEKKEVFWSPAPFISKSWADVEDEDDEDYYAIMAPTGSSLVIPQKSNQNESVAASAVDEESESEEEEGIDEEGDTDEHNNDLTVKEEVEPVLKKAPEPSQATKEIVKPLSKKELKKKELEELKAVLAELGCTQREPSGQDGFHGPKKRENDHNGTVVKKDNATGEGKSGRKKKKDKSSKEKKESLDHLEGVNVGYQIYENAGKEKVENASAIDVKDRLKKIAPMKKKKSSKEMGAAARAAVSEAAARTAKLATAAKKKEKARYT